MTVLDVLAGLESELGRAVIDENWKHRVSRQADWRVQFNAPDLTVRQDSQFMTINVFGRDITLPKAASDEHVAYEIEKIRPKGKLYMPTIAEQVAAIKARTAKVRERTVSIVAESDVIIGLANEELNKAEKVNEELRAELVGLNGGPEL
jgi:hypothetical protein